MATKIDDFSRFINREYPHFILFGKEYTIKNDKSIFLIAQKIERDYSAGKITEADMVDKKIKLFCGEEKGQEICDLLNSEPNYAANLSILNAITAKASGMTYEEYMERIKAANTPS